MGTVKLWLFTSIWLASGLDPAAVANRHLAAGRPQLALYLLDRLVTPETTSATVEAVRARILLKAGQTDEAHRVLAAGRKRWPSDPGLAGLENEVKRKAQPARSGQGRPGAQPRTTEPGIELARGRLLFSDKQYAEAAEHLQRAFDVDSRNFPLFTMLVQALYRQAAAALAEGKRDEAMRYFDRGYTLESTYGSRPEFEELQATLAPAELPAQLGRQRWQRSNK